jgi:hypothetical protein
MTVRYAVTFEFHHTPPMTHRGTIAGARMATCVARAVQNAREALHPQAWTSCVCVLLERLKVAAADDAVDPSATSPGTPSTRGESAF